MEKMKIFVSWSGARSAAVAEALKEYLPIINNAFDPWLSSEDIPKGSRSTSEIANALAAARAGIICLTPTNLNEPWILYEAGGVAKTVATPLACTVLIDIEPSAVPKPLGDFQHTMLAKEEEREKQLLALMKTLNAAAPDARPVAEVEKTFKLCWPELKKKLDNLPTESSLGPRERTTPQMFDELVDLTRQMTKTLLDSDRRTAEMFNRFENTLALALRWQTNAVTASAGRLVNPSASAFYGSQVFDPVPIASGATIATVSATEAAAAHTLLRTASQPDDVATSRESAGGDRSLLTGTRAVRQKGSDEPGPTKR